jgi:hypothetical protein
MRDAELMDPRHTVSKAIVDASIETDASFPTGSCEEMIGTVLMLGHKVSSERRTPSTHRGTASSE